MPNPSPPLERFCGGLALLLMLALFTLTIGAPTDAAPAPIIIVATPALDTSSILPPPPARLNSLEPAAPPDTIAPVAVPEAYRVFLCSISGVRMQ